MQPSTRNYRGELVSSFFFLIACVFLGWQLLPGLFRPSVNRPPTDIEKAFKTHDLDKLHQLFDSMLAENKQSSVTFLRICDWCQQAQEWDLTNEYAERGVQLCKYAPAEERAVLYDSIAIALSETISVCPQTKAIEAAERALQLAPNMAVTQNTLGYLLADNNTDLTRAQELIEKALAATNKEPDSEGKQLELAGIEDSYGWVLLKSGKTEMAIDILNRAIGRLPSQNDNSLVNRAELKTMHYHLGAAYHKAGKISNARNSLAVSLFYDPNYQLAKHELETMDTELKSTVVTHQKP